MTLFAHCGGTCKRRAFHPKVCLFEKATTSACRLMHKKMTLLTASSVIAYAVIDNMVRHNCMRRKRNHVLTFHIWRNRIWRNCSRRIHNRRNRCQNNRSRRNCSLSHAADSSCRSSSAFSFYDDRKSGSTYCIFCGDDGTVHIFACSDAYAPYAFCT